MTGEERAQVAEMVQDMRECADNGHYFEIDAESADLLHRYIVDLQTPAGPEAGTLHLGGRDD